MALVAAGLVVLGVGVILVLLGIVFVWREAQASQTLGASKFVDSLANLLKALANQARSTYMFVFGIILIFLGGTIAGVGGLTN